MTVTGAVQLLDEIYTNVLLFYILCIYIQNITGIEEVVECIYILLWQAVQLLDEIYVTPCLP